MEELARNITYPTLYLETDLETKLGISNLATDQVSPLLSKVSFSLGFTNVPNSLLNHD